jgi:hypothetical protein
MRTRITRHRKPRQGKVTSLAGNWEKGLARRRVPSLEEDGAYKHDVLLSGPHSNN